MNPLRLESCQHLSWVSSGRYLYFMRGVRPGFSSNHVRGLDPVSPRFYLDHLGELLPWPGRDFPLWDLLHSRFCSSL